MLQGRPPRKPCETQDSLLLRHLLSIILHFLFIFPLHPRGPLADRSALDVDFGRSVERDRPPPTLHLLPSTPERDSLCAFTYYLAQLITGRITCVGGQCVSAPGLCQWFRMERRKKKKKTPKPQRDKNLLCLTQFKKKRNWPNHRKSGLLGLDQKKSS